MLSGSCPVNSDSNGSKPSIVSPEPYPVMPSSVSTRTRVASKWRRGTGSQAAWNGGSRGSRIRISRIAVIFTPGRFAPAWGHAIWGCGRSSRWGQSTPGDQLDEGLQVGRQRAVGPGERDELPDHPEGAAGAQAETEGLTWRAQG